MRAQAEGNDRAGVTEHRIYNRRFYLRQVLMARHNADGVFPQLGGHGGEASRREALELIEANEERSALARNHLCTAERGKRYGTVVMRRAPKSEAVSSPSWPRARLTMRILASSMIRRICNG